MKRLSKPFYGVLTAVQLALGACSALTPPPNLVAMQDEPASVSAMALAAAIDALPADSSVFIGDGLHSTLAIRDAVFSRPVMAALRRRGIRELAIEVPASLQPEADRLQRDPAYRLTFIDRMARRMNFYWAQSPGTHFDTLAVGIIAAARQGIRITFRDSEYPTDEIPPGLSPQADGIARQIIERKNRLAGNAPRPEDVAGTDNFFRAQREQAEFSIRATREVLNELPAATRELYMAELQADDARFVAERLDDRQRARPIIEAHIRHAAPIAVFFGFIHADDRNPHSLYRLLAPVLGNMTRVGVFSPTVPEIIRKGITEVSPQYDVRINAVTGQPITFTGPARPAPAATPVARSRPG